MPDRRRFLKLVAGALGTAGQFRSAAVHSQAPATAPRGAIRKSVLISMLPKERSYAERFALAREAGFEAIEMRTVTAEAEAAAIRQASLDSGLRVHSVMNEDHWRLLLSSSDPDVVTRSVRGMEASLRNAVRWGADTVLLVPAVVDAATSYRDAWTRSQRVIRERLLPLCQRTEGDHRRRGGLEQVPAQPASWPERSPPWR